MVVSDKKWRMNEAWLKVATGRNKTFIYLHPTGLRLLSNSNGILENSFLTIRTSENGQRGNRNVGIWSQIAMANSSPVFLSIVVLHCWFFYKSYFRRPFLNRLGVGRAGTRGRSRCMSSGYPGCIKLDY